MLATAAIIGRNHRLKQQNCQDFTAVSTLPNHTTIGIVLDGCGSKYKNEHGTHPSHNEVGANLLGQFATQFLSHQLTHINDTESVIHELSAVSLGFLADLLNLYNFADDAARHEFVYTNLLCTIVGFVARADTAVFFWRGDGWLIHNDTHTDLNSNNHPDYLAYDLLSSEAKGLHTKTITASEMQRIGAATDGWSTPLLSQLTTPQNSITLQRWVNVQAKQAPHFEDDAAIAICWPNASGSQSLQSRGDEEQGRRGEFSPHPPTPSPHPPIS